MVPSMYKNIYLSKQSTYLEELSIWMYFEKQVIEWV